MAEITIGVEMAKRLKSYSEFVKAYAPVLPYSLSEYSEEDIDELDRLIQETEGEEE